MALGGSGLSSFSGGDFVDFYIDKAGAIKQESDTDEGTMVVSEYIQLLKSAITTPNGDSLDNYIILWMESQIYLNPQEDSIDWHTTKWSTTTGGIGVMINEAVDRLVIHAGNTSLIARGSWAGNTRSTTSTTTVNTKPMRFRIRAVKI